MTRTGLALMLALAALPAAGREPVRPVAQLDLSRYAGQWHEVARLPMFFQRKCAGDITAQYTLRDDGLVGVRNACRTDDGDVEVAEGVARPVAGHPGRLEVRFAPDWLSWLPLVWADYWVVALDPDYRWAVVGTPNRKYLWILSRSPGMSRELYDRLVADAAAMGFDVHRLVVSGELR